jgi:hypothetical protein
MKEFISVSVPPKQVFITDNRNQQIAGLMGPVEEGSNVQLICLAKGGML